MEEKSLYDAFYACDEKYENLKNGRSLYDAFYAGSPENEKPVEKVVLRPRMIRYHNDPVKYSLNYFKAVNFFQEKYPKSEWHIQYLFNPFTLDYTSFILVKKEQKTWNPFNDYGTAKNLWDDLRDAFPELMFKEQFFYRRDYDQEFLFKFLVNLGYNYPAERRVTELYNPFSMEKIPVYYDENGERYLIVNGQREYAKKPMGR